MKPIYRWICICLAAILPTMACAFAEPFEEPAEELTVVEEVFEIDDFSEDDATEPASDVIYPDEATEAEPNTGDDVLAEEDESDLPSDVEPTSIVIPNAPDKLGVGETHALAVEVYSDDALIDAPVSFRSSKKSVCKVGADGKLTAKGRGTATITVTTENGVQTEFKVKVVRAPKSVKLSAKSAKLGYDVSLGLGESFALSPKLSSGSASAIRYSGYDDNVIKVSEDGVVTAVGTGATWVTATTFNKKKAKCTVTVLDAPDTVELGSDCVALCVGSKYTLSPSIPANTASSLRFRSLDEGIVKTNGAQLIAVSEGVTDVIAETFNGNTDVCHVEVYPAPAELTVTPSSATIGVKQKDVRIEALLDGRAIDGGCRFKSSKTHIAKVDANGVITGVRTGDATITVTSYDGKLTKKVKVKVYAAPTGITLTPAQIYLDEGTSFGLTAGFKKGQRGSYTIQSNDPSVATVDESGLVTAVGVGTTEIAVTTYNNKTARSTVHVIPAAASIDMAEEVSLQTTEAIAFAFDIYDANGEAYLGIPNVTVEPAAVAKWQSGKLTGLACGTCTLTVTAGTVTKSCIVEVTSIAGTRKPMSVAHRGGGGHHSENSLEAFANAGSYGADAVELDVMTTKDGVQVVHHDASFKSGGKSYAIKDYTYSKLLKLKPDLCTLDEAVALIARTGLRLQVELKSNADGAECVRIVNAYGMSGKTLYMSFTMQSSSRSTMRTAPRRSAS